MSYPGLSYPKDTDYLTKVKDRGYFILVDRNATNISLLPGGDINKLLNSNNQLLFIFSVNIAGTRQDIIDALYLNGYNLDDITKILSSGINIDNVNTSESQVWIELFKNQNNLLIVPNTQTTPTTQVIVPRPQTTPTTQVIVPRPQTTQTTPTTQVIVPRSTTQVIEPRPTTPTQVIVPRPTTQVIVPRPPTTPTNQLIIPQALTTPTQVTIPISPTQVILPRPPTTPMTLTIKERVAKPLQGENPPNLSYPVTSNYTPLYILYLRQSIHDAITKTYLGGNANFEQIPNILQVVFQMYDQMFFGNRLSEIMRQNNINLTLTYGNKLTKTGGYCDRQGCNYTIKLSQPIILGTFRHGEKSHTANGLQCNDRLECLLNVFEHELIHFIIGITHGHVKKDPVYKSHGNYFQQLVRAYFGHTEYKHALNQDIETAGKREDFTVGDLVSYKSTKTNTIVTGEISKLNPIRATIGQALVPYAMLRPATNEEIQNYRINGNTRVTENNPSPVTDYQPRVGDIVSFTIKGEISTGSISQINPKTVIVGLYTISKGLIRPATDAERTRFLLSPAATAIKAKSDFHVGQTVQFTHSKTNQVVTGVITKLNPSRAVIGNYTVPYAMLRFI